MFARFVRYYKPFVSNAWWGNERWQVQEISIRPIRFHFCHATIEFLWRHYPQRRMKTARARKSNYTYFCISLTFEHPVSTQNQTLFCTFTCPIFSELKYTFNAALCTTSLFVLGFYYPGRVGKRRRQLMPQPFFCQVYVIYRSGCSLKKWYEEGQRINFSLVTYWGFGLPLLFEGRQFSFSPLISCLDVRNFSDFFVYRHLEFAL